MTKESRNWNHGNIGLDIIQYVRFRILVSAKQHKYLMYICCNWINLCYVFMWFQGVGVSGRKGKVTDPTQLVQFMVSGKSYNKCTFCSYHFQIKINGQK